MYNWRKGIAQWRIKDTLYLSVVFTWDLPTARKIAEASKLKVVAGGGAVNLMPEYLADVAEIGGELPYRPLDFHNPLATFTSRGCVNRCEFCAVHRIEGDLIEIEDFPVRPIVCDNNLLATSITHFDRVIDRLKTLPFVDFNQGLEAGRFEIYHAIRIAEIKHAKVRFSLDSWEDKPEVHRAIDTASKHGLNDIGVYVLVGFNDTPAEAREKLEWIRSLGIRPNVMRFQPIEGEFAMAKNSYVLKGWTKKELDDITRYYSRLRFLEHIPFEKYSYGSTAIAGSLFGEVA